MSPTVVSEFTSGTLETHILDALELTDGVLELADAPIFQPGALRVDMVGGADSDGTVPMDPGHYDNSVLTLPLRAVKQASADDALHKLGLVVAKLEAIRRAPDGLVHLWTPKDATDTWELTARSGEIVDLPMDSRGDKIGWLLRAPRFTVVLSCDPFMYRQGELVTYGPVTSSLPVFSLTLDDVPGHVDAEATVTLTDAASQARRHVEGGIGEDSAAPLLIDSADLIPLAASVTTRTGAYNANGVLRTTLAPQVQACVGTGNLGHVGVHRVKARVWATSTGTRVRLAYRTGDGTYSYTPWIAPVVANDFCEVEFGAVTMREVTNGAQRWDGRIEAYSAAGDTLDADYIEVLSAQRWWKIRTPYLYQAGTLSAADDFTGAVASSALGGRALPVGAGSWATTGATTDLTAQTGTLGTIFTRQTSGDSGYRVATFGSAVYSAVEFGYDFRFGNPAKQQIHGWRVRQAGAGDYLDCTLTHSDVTGLWTASVVITISGTPATLLAATFLSAVLAPNTTHRGRVVIAPSGQGVFTIFAGTTVVVGQWYFQHSALATGGALDDGTCALLDSNPGAQVVGQFYDNVYAAIPPLETIVCYLGRSIEIRHDACERESSDAATWATLSPRGGRAFVPCAGSEGRSTRLWGKARRNDIDGAADSSIADATTLVVTLRPRYRVPTNP